MTFIKPAALILAFSVQASAFSLPRAFTRGPTTRGYAVRGNRDFDWYDDGYYDYYGGGEGYYGWGDQGEIVAGDAEAPWSSSSPENIVPRGEAAQSKTPLRGTAGTGQQSGPYRQQSPSSQYGPPRSVGRGQQNQLGRGMTGAYAPPQMNTVESPWSSSTDEYIVPRGEAARKAPLRGRTETGQQPNTSYDRRSSSASQYDDPRNAGPVRQRPARSSMGTSSKPQINTVESPWSTSTDEFIAPRGEAARKSPSRRQPPTDQQQRTYTPRSSSAANEYNDPRNAGPVQQRRPARGATGPYVQPQMNTVEAPWSTSTDEYIVPRGEAARKAPLRGRTETGQQPSTYYDRRSSSATQYEDPRNAGPVRPARGSMGTYQQPQMNTNESPWSSSTNEYIVPRGEPVRRTPLRGETENEALMRAQASRIPPRDGGPERRGFRDQDIQPKTNSVESPWSASSTDEYIAPRSRESEQEASWRRQMETGQRPPSRGTMATERQSWTNYDEAPWPETIDEYGEPVQNAPWRGEMEPGQPQYRDTDQQPQTDDYRYADGPWSPPTDEYFVPRGDAPIRDAALRGGPFEPEMDFEAPPRRMMETEQPPFRGRRDTGLQAQANYIGTSRSSSRSSEPAQRAPARSQMATDPRSRTTDPLSGEPVRSTSMRGQIEASQPPLRGMREAQLKPRTNDVEAPWSSSVGENIVPRDGRASRKTPVSRVEERNSKQPTSSISSLTSTYVAPSSAGPVPNRGRSSPSLRNEELASASKSRTKKRDDKGFDWGDSLRELFSKTAKALVGDSESSQKPSNGGNTSKYGGKAGSGSVVASRNGPAGDKPKQGSRMTSMWEPTRQVSIVLNEAESPGTFIAPPSGSVVGGGEPIRKMSPNNTSKGGSRVGTTRLRSMMLNDVESPWTSSPTYAVESKGQPLRDYPSKDLAANATKFIKTTPRTTGLNGSIRSGTASTTPALVLGPDGSDTFDRPARTTPPRNKAKTVTAGTGFLDDMESAQAITSRPPSTASGAKTTSSYTASVDGTSVSVGGAVTELYPRAKTNKADRVTSSTSNATTAKLPSGDVTSVPIVGAVMDLLSRKKVANESSNSSTPATSGAPTSYKALVGDTSVPVGAAVKKLSPLESEKRTAIRSSMAKAQAFVDDPSISVGGAVTELPPRKKPTTETRSLAASVPKARASVDGTAISIGGAVTELPPRKKPMTETRSLAGSVPKAQASVDGTAISVGGAVTELPPRKKPMTETRSLAASVPKAQASVDDTTISVGGAVTELPPRKEPMTETRSISRSMNKAQASVDGTTISVGGAVTELPPREKTKTGIESMSTPLGSKVAASYVASVDEPNVDVGGTVMELPFSPSSLAPPKTAPRETGSAPATPIPPSSPPSVDYMAALSGGPVKKAPPRGKAKTASKGAGYLENVGAMAGTVYKPPASTPPVSDMNLPSPVRKTESSTPAASRAEDSTGANYISALGGGPVKKMPPRGKPKTATKGIGYLDNMGSAASPSYSTPVVSPTTATPAAQPAPAWSSLPQAAGASVPTGGDYLSALGDGPVKKMPPRGMPKTATKGAGYLDNMGRTSPQPNLTSKTTQEASKALPPPLPDVPPPTEPKAVSPSSTVSKAPEAAKAATELSSVPMPPVKIPRPAPPAAQRSDTVGETNSDYLSAFKSMRSFFGGSAGAPRGTTSSSGSASYLSSIGSGAPIKKQLKTGDKPKAGKNAMGTRYLENMSTPRVAKDWSTARGSATTVKGSQTSSQPVVKTEAKVEATSPAAFVPRKEAAASAVDMPKTEAISSPVPDPVDVATKSMIPDIPKPLDLPQAADAETNVKLYGAAPEQKGEYEDDLELEDFEAGLDPSRFLVLFGINLGKIILIMIFLGLSYDLVVTSMPLLVSKLGATSAHAMSGDMMDSLPKIAEHVAKHPPAGIFATDDLNEFTF